MNREILRLISDRTLSASQIAEALLELSSSLPREELPYLAKEAFRLRPAMPILGNVLLLAYEEGPYKAKRLLKESIERAITYALKRFGGARAVATISNSFMVREFLLRARPKRVLVLKSEPGGEGIGLAKVLKDKGIDALVIDDSACFYACLKADFVVSGADALYEDGFLNKIGTRLLAICAREAGKDYLVISTSMKFDPKGAHVEEYYERVDGTPLFEFVPKGNAILCLEDGAGKWRYRPPYSKKSVM